MSSTQSSWIKQGLVLLVLGIAMPILLLAALKAGVDPLLIAVLAIAGALVLIILLTKHLARFHGIQR
jgi:hypothetical protein